MSEPETNTNDIDVIDGPSGREGLPPGYRMRADKHYVEHLSAAPTSAPLRSVLIGDIDAPEPPEGVFLGPLMRSIRTFGVLHPLLVLAEGGRYKVIAGRKRLRAAKAIGLTSVPCFVHFDLQDALALGQADNLQCEEPSQGVSAPAGTDDALKAHTHLSAELAGIVAAQRLLASHGPSTAQRVAFDLIRMHTTRAQWLNQVTMLSTRVHGSAPRQLLGAIIDEVVGRFAPEIRLAGLKLRTRIDDGAYVARFAGDDLAIGLAGAIVASIPFAPVDDESTLTITAIRAGELLTVTAGHSPTRIEPALVGRFFDSTWVDRPGGWQATIGAVTLKTAVESHGGEVTCEAHDREFLVRMTFPRN